MILAGDIGGTKTELSLFENVAERKIYKEQRFASREHSSLEEIVSLFLQGVEVPIRAGCLGVAGPIENDRCKATNLPWIIEKQSCFSLIGAPSFFLLNDLVANSWGIHRLEETEIYTLVKGKGEIAGNQALISAGTGLGEAGLYWDGKEYVPLASEGGHCDFAPTNEEEVEIWRYLQRKFGTVSYERLLCGAGFSHLYHFFVEEKKEKEHPEVRKRLSTEDPAKVIYEYGMQRSCSICQKVVSHFLSIYGAEAGNVALKFLASGGIYIGGGIAPKILEGLKNGIFYRSFLNKGRLSTFLSSLTIKIILNQKTALLGAAYYAEKHG